MVGAYPPFVSRWFWKSLIPIFLMHGTALWLLVELTLGWTDIVGERLPARMVYGFVAVVLLVEWRLSLRIIRACQPRQASGNSRR